MWQETGRTTLWALHLFPRQQLNKTRPCTPPSPFSELQERVRKRERDCQLSQWGMLCSRLHLSFSTLSPLSSSHYSAARSKKKRCDWVLITPKLFPSPSKKTAAVQAWKCSRLRRHKSAHERAVCNKRGKQLISNYKEIEEVLVPGMWRDKCKNA